MRNLLLIPLLLLTSCGTFATLSKGVSDAREMLGEVRESIVEFKDMSAEAKKTADKDGDGNLDLMERLAYLLALGGGAAEIVRRRMKKTNESVDVLHARIDRERTKRKANEAATAS